MNSRIVVRLIERYGTDEENGVEKVTHFNQDYLQLEDDVLPAFENALRGFGFNLDGKHLEVVKDES